MQPLNYTIVLVFFVYGLAFFSMGLAMMLEARRAPLLAEARLLWPLAIFGFVHGSHEWLEMSLLIGEWFKLTIPSQFVWVRLGLLVISFSSLLVYGLQVLGPQPDRLTRRDILLGIGLVVLYGLVVLATSLAHQKTLSHWMEHADALSRYLLAIPGAAIAGLALGRQAQNVKAQDRRDLSRYLQLAAFGFAFYSLTQIFVPRVDFFPAMYVNSESFLALTGSPIQVFRAILAIIITYGLVRATQVVEDERQRELVAAQKARLQALEQVQRELIEREALRKELLRHTVIAQEEERARLARELHDETAQILTALSLDLATLRTRLPGDPKTDELLAQLQSLSRQMSLGIYRMVHDLRPAQLDDLGLVAALNYLVEEERKRSNLEVELEVQAPCQRLDPLVETVLFRIAQEALINVARHAQCDRARLHLQCASDQIILRIQDEGAGFDQNEIQVPPRGWGLESMRERAESIGGQLQISSSPGRGTVVEMVLSISEAEPSNS